MIKLLAVIVVALVLFGAGCVGSSPRPDLPQTPAEMVYAIDNDIVVGMGQIAVLRELGPPDRRVVSRADQSETWIWGDPPVGDITFDLNDEVVSKQLR